MSDYEKAVLGEEEVRQRIQQYNRDGKLAKALAMLWADCEDEIRAFMLRQMESEKRKMEAVAPGSAIATSIELDRGVTLMVRRYSGPVDERWVQLFAQEGAYYHQRGANSIRVARGLARRASELADTLLPKYADNPERGRTVARLLQSLAYIEMEIVMRQIILLEADAAYRQRHKIAETFEQDIADTLSLTLQESATLRDDCEQTSRAAQTTLDRALEVATAAEQSSVAMLDAARTASTLSQSIVEFRSAMTGATDTFLHMTQNANAARESSAQLSLEVRSIESILGFIRDIAGQTNLLALNATIEAARAGEAGRGFAVVAQEVKSLASQTARATDEITSKISAIQTATAQTVEANGDIHVTLEHLLEKNGQLNEALGRQSDTVTIIAASVDETARTADSISETIGAIRADAERMAGHVGKLDQGSRTVDGHLHAMKQRTAAFLDKIA